MSVITVRNLAPEVKAGIQRRAVAHGRSMEAEIRAILGQATAQSDQADEFWQAVDGFVSRTETQEVGAADFGPRRLDQPRDIELP